MINPPFAQILTEDPRGLDRVEITAEGHHLWREVLYAKPDGFRPLTLSLIRPAGRPRPLVIWVHGGAWQHGHPNFGNTAVDVLFLTDTMLAAGFAVARIAYRLSSEAKFPTQLHDCKEAVRFLRDHAATFGIDPARFAAMGESAGGHLALLMGVRSTPDLEGGTFATSSAVQAVVNWYGPTNFLTIDRQMPPDGYLPDHDDPTAPVPKLLGARIADRPDLARQASPIGHVSAATAPTLTQHGSHDRLVPYGQAVEWHGAMLAAGAHSELHRLDGADHCFCDIDPAPVITRAVAFLQARLPG